MSGTGRERRLASSSPCSPSALARSRTHRPQRLLALTPLARQIAKRNLEREINQNRQREILLLESLFEQLERGGGVVGGGAELGKEVED